MERGYISIWRKLQDSEMWKERPFTKGQAWVDLLLLANHKDGGYWTRGIWIEVKRGECGWSQIKLAERWGWSRGKVRRFLNWLKKEDAIKEKTVQHNNYLTTIIILVNYDTHQGGSTADGTADGQQTDSRRGSNNNDNNDNNVNKEIESAFDDLWKRYPNKDGKKGAQRHFSASVKTVEDVQAINTALDNYLNHLKLPENNWKHPKSGSTWFNNWRDWEKWTEPTGTGGGQDFTQDEIDAEISRQRAERKK